MLIQTENGLLNELYKKPLTIWHAYIKNLNNIFVWLTLPFLLISTCLYLIYLIFYGIFTLLSFAQNFDEHNGWLIIIKIILWLPSVALIMFVYYPAVVIGGIMSIALLPCDSVYKTKLILLPFIDEIVNEVIKEVLEKNNLSD